MLKNYWKKVCRINIFLKPDLLFLEYNKKLFLFFAKDKNKYDQLPTIFFFGNSGIKLN